jgi:pilus assembly protein CpaF
MGLFSRNNGTATANTTTSGGGGAAVLDAPPAAPQQVKPVSSGIFAKPAPSADLAVAPVPAAPSSISQPAVIQAAPALTPQQREQQLQYQQLKARIHQKLVERLDVQNLRALPQDTVRQEVRTLIRDLCQSEKSLINSADQERLMDDVMDETFGLGPLETLLKDPSISDILVNRFDRIYVERKGRLELSEVRFRDNKHLRQIIDRIVAMVGRRVDETSPMVDARLSDGSRVNAIIPPLALDGCAMSIRRFGSKPLQVEDLVKAGAFPAAFMDFMAAAVVARCNILISGGTGSGKTTLLNCLSRYIPEAERVITIEDAAELQLQQPHVVRLETRPANIEGKGEVSQRELVKNCLRMRPDRVIIGECRSGETLDMLQAMNTGHEGSMTTVHANTPRDALSRIEVMIAMAGYDIPTKALRHQTASAVQLVIQAQRITGGRRKVTRISEISGMEGDQIQMHDLFLYEQTGVDEHGHATGRFVCNGIRPKCLERIESRGIKLPTSMFQRQVFDI